MKSKRVPIIIIASVGVALLFTAAGVGLSVGGGDADGAPVEGVGAPQFVARPSSCAISGSRIVFRATGFVPGSTVTIDNPAGHYPERPIVPAQEFVAGPTPYGLIESSLKLPKIFAANSVRWMPIVLRASGQAIDGQEPGESFDAVLLASARVCHELMSSKPNQSRGRRSMKSYATKGRFALAAAPGSFAAGLADSYECVPITAANEVTVPPPLWEQDGMTKPPAQAEKVAALPTSSALAARQRLGVFGPDPDVCSGQPRRLL